MEITAEPVLTYVKKSYVQAMPSCSVELGLRETKAYHGPPNNNS